METNTLIFYTALFFLCSIIGWIGELVAKPLIKKSQIKRGVLIGPYLPIYGFGALICVFLSNLTNNIFLYFLLCVIALSILEYLSHTILKKIFHKEWWNYSKHKFNLHGKISLFHSISFGIYAVLFRLAYPLITNAIESLQPDFLTFIVGSLVGIFIIDITISAIRLRKKTKSHLFGGFIV
jgi:uncharacterized membrane protein